MAQATGLVSNTNRLGCTVRNLNYQLKQMCRRNRDGGFGTQAARQGTLTLIANQLHELGYRHMSIHSLKPKHVEALVQRWLAEGLSAGTIKPRMSAIRWWARKVGRDSVVARSNAFYGIPNRRYLTNVSKAQTVDDATLATIRDPRVRMSLKLQQAFGLRREESIKFMPSYADQGDHIRLRGSWTKGGKARTIPVITDQQRTLLDAAHRLAGKGSLIPSTRNYRQQLKVYHRELQRSGLSRMHGLRHAYAQRRYEALAGWPPPAANGPRVRDLTVEQQAIDQTVRLVISRELGHERIKIVALYCGR